MYNPTQYLRAQKGRKQPVRLTGPAAYVPTGDRTVHYVTETPR